MPKKLSKKAKTNLLTNLRSRFFAFWGNSSKTRNKRLRLHRSFHRSYREDYVRELELPGLLHHACTTFSKIFKNWRLFLPFLVLIVALNIILVGLLSEDTYVKFQKAIDDTNNSLTQGKVGDVAKAGLLLVSTITTGGLTNGMTEVQQVFAVFLALVVWLVTIYILRQNLASNKIQLRDALYNALTPFISTFCVLAVIFLQLIPIFLVIIVYSTAIATEFLTTPFYALLVFLFALPLVILSVYWLSSSFLALAIVTAPGLYPLVSLRVASDLVAGRRLKLIVRLIYLIFVLSVVWIFTLLPIIVLDLKLKPVFSWLAGIPIVPFFMLIVSCFSVIYAAAYFYLFYRRILDYDKK